MPRTISPCTFTLCSLVIALPTFAMRQQAPRWQHSSISGVPPMLQRLDQTREDVGPLSESLREVNFQADFRTPVGFQNVYRVPGRSDLLMRASGELYAIFPQSVYVTTREGLAAAVPPGTVFAIGQPGPWLLPDAAIRGMAFVPAGNHDAPLPREAVGGDSHVQTGLDGRIYPRRTTQVVGETWDRDGAPNLNGATDPAPARQHEIVRAKPPDPSTILKTIVTDDDYRRERVTALLKQAADAAQREPR